MLALNEPSNGFIQKLKLFLVQLLICLETTLQLFPKELSFEFYSALQFLITCLNLKPNLSITRDVNKRANFEFNVIFTHLADGVSLRIYQFCRASSKTCLDRIIAKFILNLTFEM